MYGIVYKFTNKINGMSYVGCSRDTIEGRLSTHLKKSKNKRSYFFNAYLKHGKENFESCTIDNAYSEEDMFEKEKFWIKFYDCMAPNGYNLTEGGGGIVNMTPEIRAKISKTKTGVPMPQLRGRVRTQEQKNNISRGMGCTPIKGVNIKTGEEIYLHSVSDGKNYGFNPSLVSAVALGNRPTHKGYIFTKISDVNTEITLDNKKSKAS